MKIDERIDLVGEVFKHAKNIALETKSNDVLSAFLSTLEGEFVSVAFEGASMGVAIKSLTEAKSLSLWGDFYITFGENHESQAHVGLGWALCELNIPLSPTLDAFHPLLSWRVLDGYGYYSGLFKRREAVREQHIPKEINQDGWLIGYNQGVGRSLWYIARGDINRLLRMIELFHPSRRVDLWRGVGLAMAYVGGTTIELLKNIKEASGDHLDDLLCGVTLAAYTRKKTHSTSKDTLFVSSFLIKDIDQKLNALVSDSITRGQSVESFLHLIKSITVT